MRHLITGGAGFIGSHLADLLVEAGDEVVVLDDLSTGSASNVAHLERSDRFRLVRGSILDVALVDQLVGETDDVYHLAAAVGVRRVVEQQVSSLVVNSAGTESVLRAAAAHARPVLIASSSEVYGDSSTVPFTESAGVQLGGTNRPRWGYACSKAFDEFLALAYAREQALRVVVCRFFNTVGPRQTGRYGMVVPRFVRQALSGEPILVHGDGAQSRCFAWVGDVVRALPKLLAEPRASGQVCNLGSDEEVSVAELARRVQKITASPSRIEHVAHRDVYGDDFDDLRRRVPCLKKAHELIGYRPTLRLDEILRAVIAFESAGGASTGKASALDAA